VLTRTFHIVIILYTYYFTAAAVQTASYTASIILLSVAAGKTPTYNIILLYSGVYDGVPYILIPARVCPFPSIPLTLYGIFQDGSVMFYIKCGSTIFGEIDTLRFCCSGSNECQIVDDHFHYCRDPNVCVYNKNNNNSDGDDDNVPQVHRRSV